MYPFPTPTITIIMTPRTHSQHLLSQSLWRHVPIPNTYYHSHHDATYPFPTSTITVIMTPCTNSQHLLSQSSWRLSSRTPNLRTTEHQTTKMYDNSQRSPNRRMGWLLDYFKENVVRGVGKWMAQDMRMAGTWWFVDRKNKIKKRPLLAVLRDMSLFRQCTWTCETMHMDVRNPPLKVTLPVSFAPTFASTAEKTLRSSRYVCSYLAKRLSVVGLFIDGNERPVW
jgi:hypothetical protein